MFNPNILDSSLSPTKALSSSGFSKHRYGEKISSSVRLEYWIITEVAGMINEIMIAKKKQILRSLLILTFEKPYVATIQKLKTILSKSIFNTKIMP